MSSRASARTAASCGWCLSKDHEHCRPEGTGWKCDCNTRGHKPSST